MGRLFISFYLFIALSLIALAALLNTVFFSDDGDVAREYAPVVALIARLQQLEGDALHNRLQNAGWSVARLPRAALALPAPQQQQLAQQHYLLLHDENDITHLYWAQADGQLLRIRLDHKGKHDDSIVWLYSGVFFVTLGALIAIWLWPLWRDLNTLKRATESLRDDGSMNAVALRPSSVIASIALAFNRLRQQVKDLLQTQRELTGAVAHELRTPLSRMKFALASSVNDKAWQDLQQDVAELEGLVQEMLDYASMQSTMPELNFGAIPVAELLAQLRSKVLIPAHIQFDCDSPALTINGDSHFIERALQNIVLNALRHAHSRVRLHVEHDSEQLRIICDDDGSGVAPAERERIFTAFYRPDSSRDRRRGGAGLGLAIVKRIQQWHDGDCWVGDAPQGGARFVLSYKIANQ